MRGTEQQPPKNVFMTKNNSNLVNGVPGTPEMDPEMVAKSRLNDLKTSRLLDAVRPTERTIIERRIREKRLEIMELEVQLGKMLLKEFDENQVKLFGDEGKK